jgi:flagellar capping protein FliD
MTLPGGILTSMTDSASRLQSDLDLRIKEGERRIDIKRTRLEAQFVRMESAVAQLQAQGQRLNSQLGNLS